MPPLGSAEHPRKAGRMLQHLDTAVTWMACLFAALCAVCARLTRDLWNVATTVPTDPMELGLWKRRRRWMIWSEVAALPCFATVSLAAALYWEMPIAAAILMSIALGGLGFGFLLNGLQAIIRKKLGIEP